jgi:hypothetical protein
MAHCQMRFAVIASALVLLLGAAACTACASPTAAEANPQALAAFTTAYEQGQQIADSSRAAAERAMQMLPSPLGVSRDGARFVPVRPRRCGADPVSCRRHAAVSRRSEIQRGRDDGKPGPVKGGKEGSALRIAWT